MKSLSMAQLKMVFGFLLLICIAVLSGVIAIGHVRQETSYGLPEILGGLLVLAGGFSNWAFGESRASARDVNGNGQSPKSLLAGGSAEGEPLNTGIRVSPASKER